VDPQGSSWLATGRQALATGRWSEARQAFAKALDVDPTPEAHAGSGEAAWWLGDTLGAIDHLQRSYAGYIRLRDPLSACHCALELFSMCFNSLGRRVVARGWLQRAARLVDKHGLDELRGWVTLMAAGNPEDADEAERAAHEAIAIAEEVGDADLELCARSQLGACMVQRGLIEEGTALLDESMAAALAGEGRQLKTVVVTSCNTLIACGRVAEFARAMEWVRAAQGFTERYGCPHVSTVCRTQHAQLLFHTGDWAGAEEHFTAALHIGREAEPAVSGEALAGLAELRLAQGRQEEAAELVRGLDAHASAARVQAALLIAGGQPLAAMELLSARLRQLDRGFEDPVRPLAAGAAGCLERAGLLALQGEAAVEAGRVADAAASADALERLGRDTGFLQVVADGAVARAGALLAAGAGGEAVEPLELALAHYRQLSMPLGVARCQLLLARARTGASPEAAVAGARAALAAFEELGAGRHADLAAALLRELGVKAARRGPRGTGLLTRRERQVLELLEAGLSNRAIAGRLHLSLKTVEHHVSSVLSKLDLRSRAEAAAYAVRHLHPDGSVDDPLDA